MAGKHISLLVHFIWSTAGREPWMGFDWQDDLFGIVGGIMKKKNARLICAGGMFDHVHLYIFIAFDDLSRRFCQCRQIQFVAVGP
ncbi:MAG TPA: transposase [Pyrinomonadaceae bacterium]|nr:transposase [Pyrinomonadaceae bacterium]